MLKRDWTTCSKCANHSRLNSHHDGENLYDYLMIIKKFILILHKIFDIEYDICFM